MSRGYNTLKIESDALDHINYLEICFFLSYYLHLVGVYFIKNNKQIWMMCSFLHLLVFYKLYHTYIDLLFGYFIIRLFYKFYFILNVILNVILLEVNIFIKLALVKYKLMRLSKWYLILNNLDILSLACSHEVTRNPCPSFYVLMLLFTLFLISFSFSFWFWFIILFCSFFTVDDFVSESFECNV